MGGFEIENMKTKGKNVMMCLLFIFLLSIFRRGSLIQSIRFSMYILCLMIIAQSHFIFRFPNDITLKYTLYQDMISFIFLFAFSKEIDR